MRGARRQPSSAASTITCSGCKLAQCSRLMQRLAFSLFLKSDQQLLQAYDKTSATKLHCNQPRYCLCLIALVMQVMLADIEACSDLGADGVVIGCLQPDGAVDVAATQQLVHKAKQHVGWQ